jgi:hypothetical protein
MNDGSTRWFSASVAGGSFGFLAGIVLGLSLSPLVAQFLAPLLAIVTAVLGLQEGVKEEAAFTSRKTARAIGFALLCVVGIFSGMWIRINDVLSPNFRTQLEEIDKLKLDSKIADEIKEGIVRRAFLGSAVRSEEKDKAEKTETSHVEGKLSEPK